MHGELPGRQRFAWLHYCFPIGSFSGVPIGLHWTWPIMFLVEVYRANEHGGAWAGTIAISILILFVIVLFHEFSHVFAARSEHVPAERVMLWPLGGLATLGGHAHGRAEVKIAGAGPAMNLAFAIVLLPILWLAGIRIGFQTVNIFHWYPVELQDGIEPSFVQMLFWVVYKTNLLVLLFNLIPAYPLDGGRILCGFLHERYGRLKSILISTSIGIFFGVIFFIWGIMIGTLILSLIGVFVVWQSITIRRSVRLQAMEGFHEQGFMGYDFSMGHTSLERSFGPADRAQKKEEARRRAEQKKAQKEADREREIEREVDRLLEKIHESGMHSLTKAERTFLERASRRDR